MRSVLISIRLEWCEKIANGQKTIEIRKTKPKIDTPFKCYIYCTLPPRSELFRHGGIVEYANELIRLRNSDIVYDYGMRFVCDRRPYTKDNFLCQKVIGEFVCDTIIGHCEMANADIAEQQGCIRREELLEYAGRKELYGWHISELKIYDTPKEITDFWAFDKCPYVTDDGCTYKYHCFRAGRLKRCGNKLTRPPQSWCYVEEKKQ